MALARHGFDNDNAVSAFGEGTPHLLAGMGSIARSEAGDYRIGLTKVLAVCATIINKILVKIYLFGSLDQGIWCFQPNIMLIYHAR